MPRLLVILLSLVLVFTSSCTMKRMLWEYMGVENTVSVNQKSASSEEAPGSYFSENGICITKAAGSVEADEAKILSSASLMAPVVLFFALLILPWSLYRWLQERKLSLVHFKLPFPSVAVPIYLKQGQLVYYS